MENKTPKSKRDPNLRKKAEEKLKALRSPIENLSDLDVRKLAHELQVHQMELEMQNEELRKDQEVIVELGYKYSNLYDFAPVGYFTLDKSGVIIEANLTGGRMLGIAKQMLIGAPLGHFVVKGDEDTLYLHRNHVLKTQEKQICEIKMLNKHDNTYFYAKLESNVAHDTDDSSDRLWIIMSDITEQKKAEEEVHRLSCAIEQSPVSVIITNTEGNIEYVNPQFTKTTGYLKEEVLGKNPRILKSGEVPHDFYIKLWSTIKAGYEWKGRFRNKKKNGELYWEYQSISPIKNEQGIITNFVAVKIDDTERVIAEQHADKVEKRFARMLEISEDAIISTDEEQRMVIFNKGAESLFGYSSKEVMGKPITSLIPERFRVTHGKYIAKFRKSKTDFLRLNERFYELFGLKKNGEEFPAEITISKFEEDGKTVYTAIVHDVTERKRMENEVFKMQKLESVGILAGGLAHDFNNILTSILGNNNLAEILLKTGNINKVSETLLKTEKATIRARDLTQQLLTFSKGGEPVKKAASINALLKETSEFASRGSNVRCEFCIPEDLWTVEVDEGQINQVIHNLIINGVQAMPKGGVIKVYAKNINHIDKKLTVSLKPGKYVVISVEDHGIGIKKEDIATIFDPYFTTKQQGTGLGLTSSYSIVNKHNGLITVESEVGRGSTFHTYLPTSTDSVTKQPNKDSNELLTGNGNILFMDDDEDIKDLANVAFTSIGYNIKTVKDGKEAIELYKKANESSKSFDVVVLDLTIPGSMGGKETIKELRKFDAKAKAIVMSGYSNDPIMADYKKYGFDGVICKPFMIDELNDVLQNVINGDITNEKTEFAP